MIEGFERSQSCESCVRCKSPTRCMLPKVEPNCHYVQLGQRLNKAAAKLGKYGRLRGIDPSNSVQIPRRMAPPCFTMSVRVHAAQILTQGCHFSGPNFTDCYRPTEGPGNQ